MTYYAEYDPSAPQPCPVIAWYAVTPGEKAPSGQPYPDVPGELRLLTLSLGQWNLHFSNPDGWAVSGGQLVPSR